MNIKAKKNKEIKEISSNKLWLTKREQYFLIFYFKRISIH
jgi:hypothetical protein